MISRRSVLWGFLFSLFVCVGNIDGRELDFRTYHLKLEDDSGEDYRCRLVRSQQEMENSLENAGSSGSQIAGVGVDWNKNIAILVTGEKVVSVELFFPEENRVRLRYEIFRPWGRSREQSRGQSREQGLSSRFSRWAILVEFPRLAEVDHYECGRVFGAP